jgi:hypothetical protein
VQGFLNYRLFGIFLNCRKSGFFCPSRSESGEQRREREGQQHYFTG